MLIYGDPRFEQRLGQAVASLRKLARQTCFDLDELRALLIQAGQLEQGIADVEVPAGLHDGITTTAQRLTDAAAEAFVKAWRQGIETTGQGEWTISRELMLGELEKLERFDDCRLQIKVPEGFAFYALFPEQYCAAARDWVHAHAAERNAGALVVGIRSIGTSLSAVVKASLSLAEWAVFRITVRPVGPPFERRVELSADALVGAASARLKQWPRCGLVVDEGPGLSGSSMAAVAETLASTGIQEISFFPGHEGEPGSAASPRVKSWWGRATRWFTPREQLRWNGQGLAESLAEKAVELIGGTDQAEVEDLSGGHWRKHAFPSEQSWPVSPGMLERMKFRCQFARHNAVLWKFSGLNNNGDGVWDCEREQMARMARTRFSPAVLGTFRGFTAVLWVEGRRLNRDDGRELAVQAWLADYLAASARPELPVGLHRDAVARLGDMLYWNVKESLGEVAAERARLSLTAAQAAPPGPSYGDGRMAPWEWVRSADGSLWKTDCTGHDCDHTLIGKQSWLWDLAGTLVEWDLELSQASVLRSCLYMAS